MAKAASNLASVAPAKGLNTYQIAGAFNAILTSIGRENLGEILFNWNESEYNADIGKITLQPGRDRGFSRGAEGGKVAVSKKEFLVWLMSEAPFDPVVYGPKIAETSSWTTLIAAARAAYLRAVPAPPGATSAAHESKTFKDWFGDGKVVDFAGKPLLVFHGSASVRTEFAPRPGKRYTFGHAYEVQGSASFFTPDRTFAETFGKAITPAYLQIHKLLDLREGAWGFVDPEAFAILESYFGERVGFYPVEELWTILDQPESLAALRALGYDGVALCERDKGGQPYDTYAVFEATQVWTDVCAALHEMNIVVDEAAEDTSACPDASCP